MARRLAAARPAVAVVVAVAVAVAAATAATTAGSSDAPPGTGAETVAGAPAAR